MNTEIIADWKREYADQYGKTNLLLHHRLRETGLFTKAALAELIERYPTEHYSLNTMGDDPANPVWREGVIEDVPGATVIDAIENGRMWLNLRRVMDVDERYAKLLGKMFAEFEERVPGLSTYKQTMGILISSPKSQVFYHIDIPGQSLWQLEGRKKVYVYPNTEPYLDQKAFEIVVMGETEEEVPYHPSFEAGADVRVLEPGQMMHWPLNCPHRVVNEDCLNISVTTEHYTTQIAKSYAVNYANGVLRNRFGVKHLSQSTSSASFYPKAALTMAWRKLNLQKARRFIPTVDFTLDPASPTRMADIPAMQKQA